MAEIKKNILKAKPGSEEALAIAISKYNALYFRATLGFAGVAGVLLHPGLFDAWLPPETKNVFLAMVGLLVYSRAMEIFLAFILDAVAKLDHVKSSSTLSYGTRLKLALKSYVELLVGFGLLYFLLPSCYFKGPENFHFQSIIEAIYFSGATMTTLGYGDISPSFWLTQVLVIFQLFCGMTLALVSFTVYTSLGLAQQSLNKSDPPA